jgi:hypothetical protein
MSPCTWPRRGPARSTPACSISSRSTASTSCRPARAGRVRAEDAEDAEDIVLVELLSVDIPNGRLVRRLHRAAVDRGLGEVVEQ